MKSKEIIPTQVERVLPVDRYIVSTTDCSGRITAVNDVFIDYAGYDESELIGIQHNIIRHPDMPRSVFWLCWDTLEAGEEFYGYVKNMSKDGGHYWVFSHISPINDVDGGIVGFRSIRRHAKPEAVAKVIDLYRAMSRAEAEAGTKEAIQAGLGVLREFLSQSGLSYEQMVAKL